MKHFRLYIACLDFRYRSDVVDGWGATEADAIRDYLPCGWTLRGIAEIVSLEGLKTAR